MCHQNEANEQIQNIGVGVTANELDGVFFVVVICGLKPRDFIKEISCSGISANTLELNEEEGIIRMKYIETYHFNWKAKNRKIQNSTNTSFAKCDCDLTCCSAPFFDRYL